MQKHIWVAPGPPDLVAIVNEIAALVEVNVDSASQHPSSHAAVAIVFAETPPPPLPTIAVGPGTDIALPGDATILAQALIELSPASSAHQGPEIIVASWQPLPTLDRLVAALARHGHATVCEATGAPHGRRRVPIPWHSINPHDPPHLGRYRSNTGEPAITSAAGTCVSADDPRVAAVAGTAAGRVIVNCGIWNPAVDALAASLSSPRLLLVGELSQYRRLYEVIGAARLLPTVLASNRRSAPEMVRAAAEVSAHLVSLRRPRRLWQALHA